MQVLIITKGQRQLVPGGVVRQRSIRRLIDPKEADQFQGPTERDRFIRQALIDAGCAPTPSIQYPPEVQYLRDCAEGNGGHGHNPARHGSGACSGSGRPRKS